MNQQHYKPKYDEKSLYQPHAERIGFRTNRIVVVGNVRLNKIRLPEMVAVEKIACGLIVKLHRILFGDGRNPEPCRQQESKHPCPP